LTTSFAKLGPDIQAKFLSIDDENMSHKIWDIVWSVSISIPFDALIIGISGISALRLVNIFLTA